MAIEDFGIPRPAGLGPAGTVLWCAIIGKYELRPDEVRLLSDASREADIIDRIQDELDGGAPLMVKGSMGQWVASPLISEARQHRTTLKTLLAALRLSDDGTRNRGVHSHRGVASVSDAARRAARARWGSGGVR
jgi:hypothetical protein